MTSYLNLQTLLFRVSIIQIARLHSQKVLQQTELHSIRVYHFLCDSTPVVAYGYAVLDSPFFFFINIVFIAQFGLPGGLQPRLAS